MSARQSGLQSLLHSIGFGNQYRASIHLSATPIWLRAPRLTTRCLSWSPLVHNRLLDSQALLGLKGHRFPSYLSDT